MDPIERIALALERIADALETMAGIESQAEHQARIQMAAASQAQPVPPWVPWAA